MKTFNLTESPVVTETAAQQETHQGVTMKEYDLLISLILDFGGLDVTPCAEKCQLLANLDVRNCRKLNQLQVSWIPTGVPKTEDQISNSFYAIFAS